MIQRIENAAIGVALGAVPIIACFLAGWWICIPLLPESQIFLGALAGLCLGILVDVLFLGCWVRRAYRIKTWVWKGVYVFYAVGMFGFFMGVPVFHVMLALPAGVFVGRWLAQAGADSVRLRKTARRTAAFTTGTLGLVCLASATVALVSRSTSADLQGMLGVSFPITTPMIVGLVVAGGTVILVLNWWLTVKSVERTCACFATGSQA